MDGNFDIDLNQSRGRVKNRGGNRDRRSQRRHIINRRTFPSSMRERAESSINLQNAAVNIALTNANVHLDAKPFLFFSKSRIQLTGGKPTPVPLRMSQTTPVQRFDNRIASQSSTTVQHLPNLTNRIALQSSTTVQHLTNHIASQSSKAAECLK